MARRVKIVSVPQPYAGYLITGALSMLVLPRPCPYKGPLAIVGDHRTGRRFNTTPPGLFTARIDGELSRLTGRVLGVVQANGQVEADETEVGIPYVWGIAYLHITRPMIYADPPACELTTSMQSGPVALLQSWEEPELIDLDQWRARQQLVTGPTEPSPDGWTGD